MRLVAANSNSTQMEELEETSSVSSSTLRRRFQSLMSRSSSFNRSKFSPVTTRIRSKSQERYTTHNPDAIPEPARIDLCRIPETHELAFHVAIESSREVREVWDSLVTIFHQHDLPPTSFVEADGRNAKFLRLDKAVEKLKEERHLRADNHGFVAIYSFYNNEKSRFYEILQAECSSRRWSTYDRLLSEINTLHDGGLFRRYVKIEAMTVLELDGVFNGRHLSLPKCIFMLPSLEKLCLSNNHLRSLPADIGRLEKLRHLKLTHNRLKNDSIPYTLSFCKQLHTLMLDFNSLDAIPGFILHLTKLETLHRHGNQNYFRTTFMWYGCEKRERIRTASFSDADMATNTLRCATEVQSLKFWAARSIISTRCNYFKLTHLSEMAIDYISDTYKMFNVCEGCNSAKLLHEQGYFVFTFANPYLGNTCVPFQHWTCSKECALNIEIPARKQQIKMASEQLASYEQQVKRYTCAPHGTIPEHPSPGSSTSTYYDCDNENGPTTAMPGRSIRSALSRRRRCRLM